MGIALDIIGMFCIFIGISLNWFGLHYFGPIIFWLGVTFNTIGIFFIARTVKRRNDIEKVLKEYQGTSDFGDTHYHNGAEHHSEHEVHEHDLH